MAFDLNPSQRAAVEHNDGPDARACGRGIRQDACRHPRIARLIEQGTPAWSILALTFTNKAAQEMRERAAQLTDAKSAKELRVTTFHSFGLDFLRKECRALGFRGDSFSIYDQSDCQAQLRELLRGIDAGRKFDIAAILSRISIAKNAFETEDNWNTRPGDEYDEIARVVYPKYIATLRSLQALDFDDLVTETVSILSKREDIRQKWVSKIRYMMVDEYQDTNASQLELVRLLAGDHHNVMVVGDDDQAIYGWRGADVNNILDFEHHFHGTKVVKLEENYRSVASVLNVANAVLAASKAKRHGKVLKPTREAGPKVELVVCPDPEVEASAIADEIQRSKSNDPSLKWRDIAVLYRSNSQGQPVEIALRELGIPYRLLGGQKFYERKEVKDLLAYLRVALQPEEELSLRRVINYPARGIGEVALKKISAFATIRDTTMWNAVQNAEAIDDLPPAGIEACAQFVHIVRSTRAVLESTKSL
ncbi:MAG: UvrD-helicase domain-containing protein, partial [Polyangiaceae bacterium]